VAPNITCVLLRLRLRLRLLPVQAWDNFKQEWMQLRRSFRYNEYRKISALNPPKGPIGTVCPDCTLHQAFYSTKLSTVPSFLMYCTVLYCTVLYCSAGAAFCTVLVLQYSSIAVLYGTAVSFLLTQSLLCVHKIDKLWATCRLCHVTQ
jgi:hypothetical protein